MVDVQQHTLSPLQQDRQVFLQCAMNDRVGVRHVVGELAAVVEVAQVDFVERERLRVVDQGEELVFHLEHLAQPAQQRLFVQQIAHADTDPRHLVGVGRADATAGGADPGIAAQCLLELVLQHVIGHDNVGPLADEELRGADTLGAQVIQLLEQHGWIDHDAAADHIDRARVEDARGHDVQLEGAALVDNRMASVVAAAVADDQPRSIGQQIHNVALAFIAPLGTDHSDDRHRRLPSCVLRGRSRKNMHEGGPAFQTTPGRTFVAWLYYSSHRICTGRGRRS